MENSQADEPNGDKLGNKGNKAAKMFYLHHLLLR